MLSSLFVLFVLEKFRRRKHLAPQHTNVRFPMGVAGACTQGADSETDSGHAVRTLLMYPLEKKKALGDPEAN